MAKGTVGQEVVGSNKAPSEGDTIINNPESPLSGDEVIDFDDDDIEVKAGGQDEETEEKDDKNEKEKSESSGKETDSGEGSSKEDEKKGEDEVDKDQEEDKEEDEDAGDDTEEEKEEEGEEDEEEEDKEVSLADLVTGKEKGELKDKQEDDASPDAHLKVFESTFKKKMSKDAVDFVEARLRENAELRQNTETLQTQLEEASKGRTKLPDSYYEHPQAYMLSDDYGAVIQKESTFRGLQTYLEEQALKAAEGKKWNYIKQDDKGNYIIDEVEREGGPKAQAFIQMQLNKINSQITNLESEKAYVKNNFVKTKQAFEGLVNNTLRDFFPDYQDLEKETHPQHKLAKTIRQKMPPELVKSQLFPILERATLKIIALQDQLKEERAKKTKDKVLSKMGKQSVSSKDTKGTTSAKPKKSSSKTGVLDFRGDEFEEFE